MTDELANPERASARIGSTSRSIADRSDLVSEAADLSIFTQRVCDSSTSFDIFRHLRHPTGILPRSIGVSGAARRGRSGESSFEGFVVNRPLRAIDPLSRETIIAAIIRPRACSLERTGCRVKAARPTDARAQRVLVMRQRSAYRGATNSRTTIRSPVRKRDRRRLRFTGGRDASAKISSSPSVSPDARISGCRCTLPDAERKESAR